MAPAPAEHLFLSNFLLIHLPLDQVTSRLAKIRPFETTCSLHKLTFGSPCCCCSDDPYPRLYTTAPSAHPFYSNLLLTYTLLPQVTTLLVNTRPPETPCSLHASSCDSQRYYSTPGAHTTRFTRRSSQTPSHHPFYACIIRPVCLPDAQSVLTHAKRAYPPTLCLSNHSCTDSPHARHFGSQSMSAPHARVTSSFPSSPPTPHRQHPSLLSQSWQYSVPPHQQEDPAVLTITQIETDATLKKEIDLQTMYKQFGIKCLIADVSVLPERSIKPFGKAGPWKVYDSYHKLATIVHALKGATGLTQTPY